MTLVRLVLVAVVALSLAAAVAAAAFSGDSVPPSGGNVPADTPKTAAGTGEPASPAPPAAPAPANARTAAIP